MSATARRATHLLILTAIVLHALSIADHWRIGHRERHGRDFASYYYATRVAWEGGDPYVKSALGSEAQEDGTRRGVHPFFYPPPFLLTTAWVLPLDLQTAYRVWFWLNELTVLLAAAALWRWWRPLGPAVGVTLALTLALLTGIPNNHLMGQANLPVLALVVLGLWAEHRDRAVLGGALVGAACMMKMSPALFVAWWILRGRWVAVAAACGSAVIYSLISLGFVGVADQWRFYTEVLPEFGSGRYNGLGVGIDLFGNHSIPNLWDDLFPPTGRAHLVLTDTARALSQASSLALLAGTAWAFRRAPEDDLQRHAQVGAVGAVMLLVPVITYEHHLVWLIPAAVAAVLGLYRGRLGRRWLVPVALALAVWCFDLADLKNMYQYVRGSWPAVGLVLREAKFGAVVLLYVACLVVGARPPRASPTPPAPEP